MLGVMVVGEEQIYEANDALLDIIGYGRGDVGGRAALLPGAHPAGVGLPQR